MPTSTSLKVYTIDEALQILRIGRTKFWQIRKSGELRTKPVGRRVLIPEQAIHEYLGSDAA